MKKKYLILTLFVSLCIITFAQKDCTVPATFVANYDVETTPGATWTTHSGSTTSGGCVVYKVNCIIGNWYTFKTGCGDGATAVFDTWIQVYNSTGTHIDHNDDGCESYRSSVTWAATETIAYVNVRGYNSTQYGNFIVAYKDNDVLTDADGDGVADVDDDFPSDPDRACIIYFPAAGYGSLAFEDLWPAKGDYDFNDVVVDYRFSTVTNAQDYVVDITASIVAKASGAGLHNGFGFNLPLADNGLNNDLTVTGYDHQEGYITIDGTTHLESGQSHPTIIVFDDIFNVLPHPQIGVGVNTEEWQPFVPFDTTTILLTPVQNTYVANDFSLVEWNPFIIVNKNRDVEVHLKDKPPTDLANAALFGTDDDDSDPGSDRYYVTANNLPWAIDVPSSFDWPKEKVDISLAYLHFIEWAESLGVDFDDWYLSTQGYRTDSNIYEVP